MDVVAGVKQVLDRAGVRAYRKQPVARVARWYAARVQHGYRIDVYDDAVYVTHSAQDSAEVARYAAILARHGYYVVCEPGRVRVIARYDVPAHDVPAVSGDVQAYRRQLIMRTAARWRAVVRARAARGEYLSPVGRAQVARVMRRVVTASDAQLALWRARGIEAF